MYGVLCIKFETHTEPEDQSVMYGVLCIKNRESRAKLAKIRCSAPGPPPPPPVLFGSVVGHARLAAGNRRFAP